MTVADLTPLELFGLLLAANCITVLIILSTKGWRDAPLWPTRVLGGIGLAALFGLAMMGLYAARPDVFGDDPIHIASDADYDRLAPGAEFIGPDGIVRRKP